MQLKQLKLAGFKSFVEPTVIPFPSQLVAVVGPNGCGKSNIIDAVRWVLGESSAKTLRGDVMTDVIFNGSTQRKSLGQASVELVFDNSLGRLGGPYASYQEIAVKRIVTREGDSLYYLNGARCRKRDVTELFLGTGAGARSYSIIGQDTISHIIEAKPEELRAYLEEAAGVSKYKERRRETFQRINHTEENLARITDIRLELDKQLARLERQAKAANTYKALKQKELDCKAAILVLKWQRLSQEQTQLATERQQLRIKYEQHQTKYTEDLLSQNQLQASLQNSENDFQQTQVHYYELNTEIARLEAKIVQHQQEKIQLNTTINEWRIDLERTTQRLHEASAAINPCEENQLALQAKLVVLEEAFASTQQQTEDLQQKKQIYDQKWQEAQASLTNAERALEKENVRKNHLQQRHQQITTRQEVLSQSCRNEDLSSLQEQIKQLQNKQTDLNNAQALLMQQHREKLQDISVLRQQYTQVQQALHQAQDKAQALTVKRAALQSMQQAQLRKVNHDRGLASWEQLPRLAELLEINEGWEEACELVLGENLQAIVLETFEVLWPELESLQGHAVHFIESKSLVPVECAYPRLIDQVQGPLSNTIDGLLNVFAANSLAEARSWLPHLNIDASVVTKDGYWLGKGWIKIKARLQEEESVLLRQKALIKLQKAWVIAEKQVATLCQERDNQVAALVSLEEEANHLQKKIGEAQPFLQQIEQEWRRQVRVFDQGVLQLQQWQDEMASLQEDLEDVIAQKISIDNHYQANQQAVLQYEVALETLTQEKNQWQNALIALQQQRDEAREMYHQTQLQYQSEQQKLQQCRDSAAREQEHVMKITEKLATITQQLSTLTEPDINLQTTLNEKIKQHQVLEETLATLRQNTQLILQAVQEHERGIKINQQQAEQVREQIQQTQLQEQTISVRANTLLEALAELNKTMESVLNVLSESDTLTSLEQTLLEYNEKIKRLGAINLVAIEEYQTELQRKQELDYQFQDLTEALATLNAVIVKMDQETTIRLKETFEAVNTSFQTVFPRIFGGGRALLTWTCNNLLDAGIVVMAQPPGKRNSTIHSLSGGEKAMTAIALIFAIFTLNPSPFCMLDEVDAPLDELNIGRFCDLVKEMSAFVQFLFITHNKVTMEMAEHLIGITMREPGVSRMVAVDVEEALAMAE